ncbi:MAG: chitobiase/beta-hexosaminidase C-terminal domain-containing protein, partial [Acidobacteria bacterium]|nr:chitobiase/beta-hexosaminidase C-terminal domain-containing protein [Acidobacteriota bacterium]
QFARCMLNLLRIVQDERPELARDFDAATLARLLMTLVSDAVPYTIRARRAEMANWGIMGIAHLLHLGRFLHEFKAMGYFNREAWRLWNANMIQHRTLDGENIESWDDGHNWIDIGFGLDSVPYARLPAGTDDLDRGLFWDQVRVDARSKLVHVSPGGNYWPSWEAEPRGGRNTLRDRPRLDPANRYPFDLIDQEPEVRNRLHTILNGGRPTDARPPDACSDLSPYAGMAYLRGGWQPDADYLLLQNFRDRCQTQDDCSRTMYSLSKSERILVEAHGLVVDRKPDNRYCGRPLTGGKTEYCGQAGRHVSGDRFHTSAQFDFVEATQDAPYALHRRSYPDAYGLYRQALGADDPEPIRDVTVRRQVFGVRGSGLWLVCDRVESRGAQEHEYTQFFTLPVRIAAAGFADRVRLLAAAGTPLVAADERAGSIRTASPGFENVSVHCFAPAALKFAHVLNAKREHAPLPKTPLETIQAALKAGRTPETVMKKPALQPVSVRWTGTGNQVFVTALCSSPAAVDASKPAVTDAREIGELRGADGVMGCRVATRTGDEAWFQSGPQAANRLACGPVRAMAESLLVVRRAGGGTGGLVLGCTALAVGGKAAVVPGGDFEFTLDASGVLHPLQSIRRPIDTVRILPDEDVFTDRVQVAFELPEAKAGDVELRYTLDGSDPTLASPLFTGAFALEQTTMVKVRPFRKGLKETPWNFRGTDAGRTVAAIFRKRAPLPAAASGGSEPGLRFEYFEGDWPRLFSYAGYPGVLEPKKSGTVAALLDADELAKVRGTDRAFAVRYEGFVQIPAAGVYTFHAPAHFLTPTMDAGYDLRVFVDGEEWGLRPALHAENTWSVPLAAGAHRLLVSYVDYRWKEFRNEYWMAWQEEEMWKGVPVLEVSGPGLAKQSLPKAWLRH